MNVYEGYIHGSFADLIHKYFEFSKWNNLLLFFFRLIFKFSYNINTEISSI